MPGPQKQKKNRKINRNIRKGKALRYRQNNNRIRHRAAEYRIRHGIGSGELSYDAEAARKKVIRTEKKKQEAAREAKK